MALVAGFASLINAFLPLSPRPPSPPGKGETKVFYARGFAPCIPGELNPGGAEMGCNARARRGLKPGVITNSRKVLGGLGDSFKSPPALLCPHPPDPLPSGKGETKVFYARGFAPCIPGG